MPMARIANSNSIAVLIVGDLIAYLFSLVAALTIRYGEVPGRALMLSHMPSFAILFAIFLIVNFSAGLYDKQPALIRARMQTVLLKVQVINAIIGITFFYFAPVAIAPKANLFIYFVISTAALYLWRIVMFPVVSVSKKQTAILVGAGKDIQDLQGEINGDMRYGLSFKEHIHTLSSVSETVDAIAEAVRRTGASLVVADLHDHILEAAIPFFYSLIFSGVQVIDADKLYESIFGRIPLSLIKERWLVENSSSALGSRRVYDGMKRTIDIVVAGCAGIISLIVYPFVYIAMKLDDNGALFSYQDRVGQNNKIIRIIKFRTMTVADDKGEWGKQENKVTRLGVFLRKSRIDELPQLWNVIKGDISLIGPRPEFPAPVATYAAQIPYYDIRHIVKPGLSGWAQIYHERHPHHGIDTEETSNKLSYDLYYIKNRSFTLDLKIILQTLRVLLSFVGR